MYVPFVGEACAIGAALCWAVGPLIAFKGVDLLGTFWFSMYRFTLSAFALFIISLVLSQIEFGDPWTLARLAASGVIGVAAGEAVLFHAVYLLGPRRSSLIFTLHAPLTAIMGGIIFRENVTLSSVLGVTLAFSGVYTAVIFRSQAEKQGGKHYKKNAIQLGLILVFIAVVCQVFGALLAKEAISNIEPFFASFVRTFAACIAFFPIFLVRREKKSPSHNGSFQYVALSALVSTVGGMTFLLAAFATIEIFQAVILSSLSPVFYIIIMSVFRGDKFPFAAWVGTIVAVLGVIITVLLS